MVSLPQPLSFDWDKGNFDKNRKKHDVNNEECEEVFFDPEKKLLQDVLHSEKEVRHVLLGRTRSGRVLFIVFTIRAKKVRVISARDLNKREKGLL